MENKNPGTVWLRNGCTAKQVEGSVHIERSLKKAIYTLKCTPMTGELYLEEFEDKFHFNFKVYGIETPLINHIMKTYENTKANLGILFNGTKGTGKTITAKILANKMDLPVILINDPYDGLGEFIAKIESDVILFFDEYEKNFLQDSREDASLLPIMDGVFNSTYRRIFFLTTNNEFINGNMLGRPSRIRYRKTFNNLQPEVIEEYLDDNLKNKAYKQSIMECIDSLAISTIDILKAIVDELNIHDIPISEWKHFFNIETAQYSWNCKVKCVHNTEVYDKKEFLSDLSKIGTKDKDEDGDEYIVMDYHVDIDSRRINTSSNPLYMQVGEEFTNYGTIIEPLDQDNTLVTLDNYNSVYYIKILNIEDKPSLYRGGLMF